MKRIAILLAVTIAIGASSGCSQRQQDWEAARAANTAEAYEQFVKSYPDGEFAAQARARATDLHELSAWRDAVADNTLEAYREFVRRYPDGRMSDDARIRIESFALNASTPAAAVPPAESPPVTMPAPGPGAAASAPAASRQSLVTPAAAPSPAPATGAYRIQLGAFAGGEKQAMAEWRRLEREHPRLLTGLTPSIRLATTTSGHLYRLQAGTTDEARARAICARLKAAGQACVVVLP